MMPPRGSSDSLPASRVSLKAVFPCRCINSLSRNNDGTVFAMYYKGTVALTAGVKAVLGGSSDATTTPYGDSFVTFSFESGNAKYKELENGTYVAAGHFVVNEPDVKGVIVEYKVSKVVKG